MRAVRVLFDRTGMWHALYHFRLSPKSRKSQTQRDGLDMQMIWQGLEALDEKTQ